MAEGSVDLWKRRPKAIPRRAPPDNPQSTHNPAKRRPSHRGHEGISGTIQSPEITVGSPLTEDAPDTHWGHTRLCDPPLGGSKTEPPPDDVT